MDKKKSQRKTNKYKSKTKKKQENNTAVKEINDFSLSYEHSFQKLRDLSIEYSL